MKNLGKWALGASALLSPALANAQAVSGQCGFAQDAPIFGVGIAAGTDATPILLDVDKRIQAKGDRSESLRSVKVPAINVAGWTSDYAMMRMSQTAGKPIWVLTEDGRPGDVVTLNVPATNLADAFDRIAAQKGKRWRYDGENVYLLGGREWTIPMPTNRDLAIAVQDALTKNKVPAKIQGGLIRFQADNSEVQRVRGIVNQVYTQQRLNPYDVTFYKVYPIRGQIDWGSLVERTDAIESVTFDGKGATLIMDPTSASVIDAFLAREGQVQQLGSTTMVSGQMGQGSTTSAGCGTVAQGSRGLQLAGGAYERGRMAMNYTILGASKAQAGRLAVAPGSVVVIADGIPDQGGYMVAVVRPRILELQGGVPLAPSPTVPQTVPAPGFNTLELAQRLNQAN